MSPQLNCLFYHNDSIFFASFQTIDLPFSAVAISPLVYPRALIRKRVQALASRDVIND